MAIVELTNMTDKEIEAEKHKIALFCAQNMYSYEEDGDYMKIKVPKVKTISIDLVNKKGNL